MLHEDTRGEGTGDVEPEAAVARTEVLDPPLPHAPDPSPDEWRETWLKEVNLLKSTEPISTDAKPDKIRELLDQLDSISDLPYSSEERIKCLRTYTVQAKIVKYLHVEHNISFADLDILIYFSDFIRI